MDILPDDMLIEIINWIDFPEMIEYNLINIRFNHLVKRTQWIHQVDNFSYYLCGYQFRNCCMCIKENDTKHLNYEMALASLSRCHTVVLQRSEINLDVIEVLSTVTSIVFNWCWFTIVKDDYIRLQNVESITFDPAMGTDFETIYKLNVTKIRFPNYIRVYDENLMYLSKVNYLIIYNAATITDNGLYHLRNIRKISLDGAVITDNGLRHLSQIRIIKLQKCRNITNEGIQYLSNAEEIHLDSNYHITGGCARYLSNVRTLKIIKLLDFDDCDLSLLTNVKNLHLVECAHINGTGIRHLKKLKRITLSRCNNITYKGMQLIMAIPKIKLLKCKITYDNM